jgi:arylsulfatase A-like enzyme
MMTSKPNVVFFHVDNLGYGELGCYGGGILRGAETRRILFDAPNRLHYLALAGGTIYLVEEKVG